MFHDMTPGEHFWSAIGLSGIAFATWAFVFGWVRLPGTWHKMHTWGMAAHEKYLSMREDWEQSQAAYAAQTQRLYEAQGELAEWQKRWEDREFEFEQQVQRLAEGKASLDRDVTTAVNEVATLTQEWSARDRSRLDEIASLKREVSEQKAYNTAAASEYATVKGFLSRSKTELADLQISNYTLAELNGSLRNDLAKAYVERDTAAALLTDVKAICVMLTPSIMGELNDLARLVQTLRDAPWPDGDEPAGQDGDPAPGTEEAGNGI